MARLELTESYIHGNDNYEVSIQIEKPLRAIALLELLQEQGKSGEDLVAALLEKNRDSMISRIYRFKNGVMNDGPKGEPAAQGFRTTGKTHFIMHKKNGHLENTADGKDAEQWFNGDGTLNYSNGYHNGNLIPPVAQAQKQRSPAQETFNQAAADKVIALEKRVQQLEERLPPAPKKTGRKSPII